MNGALTALGWALAYLYAFWLLYVLDRPQMGEWTFSTRLERLVLQTGLRGRVAAVQAATTVVAVQAITF